MDADLSDSVKQKLKSLDDALKKNIRDKERRRSNDKKRIPRVPKELQGNNENMNKYFQPTAVSIGPYHHRNNNLKVTEDMKIQLAAIFIGEHGLNKEDAFRKIKMEIEDLKKLYEVDAIHKYIDDELTWMFLIDGCVVLHFIYVVEFMGDLDELEIVQAVTDKSTFRRDIMLLENQLPCQLLHTLIGLTGEDARLKLKGAIQMFIYRTSWNDLATRNLQALKKENTCHLLDLLRSSLITVLETNEKYSVVKWTIKKSLKIIVMPLYILMYLVRNLLYLILPQRPAEHLSRDLSIEAFTEAGFEIKLNDEGSLTEAEYRDGTLFLPVTVMDSEIVFKLFNLIAYEICVHDDSREIKVGAYIFFLASLIRRPEDVKELRAKKILYNRLDSDEEASKLFKEIKRSDVDSLGVAFISKYGRSYAKYGRTLRREGTAARESTVCGWIN